MDNIKKRLVIIDSNALIHRAYHALPSLTTKKGELVNAVYGFLLVLFKALKEFQPDFIAAAFDLPKPTFRHREFKEYKAKRPKTPKELYQQIPKVKEALKNFNIPIFEKPGYEADDIIGTISKQVSKKQLYPKIENIVVTGDLDALQLVDENTKVYALRKGIKDAILYNKKEVKQRYQGLRPKQLADMKGLKGDASDNVPGVLGVGEKTAVSLIKEFKTLENLYKEIEQKTPKAQKIKKGLREKLLKYQDQAFLSKMLVTIKCDVPIGFNIKKCVWGKYDKEKAIQGLKNLDFRSLISRLPSNEKETKKSQQKLI